MTAPSIPLIPPAAAPPLTRRLSRARVLALLAGAIGVLALLIRIPLSPGVALDDELTHYLFSLNAGTYAEALLHTWARVGNTIAYLLPALLGGFEGRRIAAVIMIALTGLVTAAIADRLGVRRTWAVLLALCFQSWITLVGYHALTQQPFMLALTVGAWAALTGRRVPAALCFGLLALIRHEGIALTGAYAAFALLERARARDPLGAIAGAGVPFVPLIAYNLIYYAVLGQWASGNLLTLVPTTEYGSGGWLHFVPFVIAGVGLPIGGLALIGIIPAARLRGRLWVFAPFALYFVIHTVIYRFGLFASGGYGVFLLPLAPAFALLAGLGLDALADRLPRRLPRWVTGIAGALMAGAIIGYGLLSPLYPVEPVHIALREAAAWTTAYVAAQPTPPTVAASHVAFWRWYDPTFNSPWGNWRYHLTELPSAALVIWDARYSAGHGADWATLTDPAGGWQRVIAFNTPLTISEPPYDGVIVFERK